MEYTKGTPYFCNTENKIKQYPYLNKNITCEILIIGGGIDGAITNYYLSQNHNVVLVDKSRLGFGCTSCATALLEYQLDDFAEDLLSELSVKQIVEVYKMGLNSISKISEFISRHGNKCEFSLRPTLMFSDSLLMANSIKKEYEFRKKHKFKCKLFNEQNNPFPFSFKAGLYCEDGGCEFNPYLFTKQMIECSKNQNEIYENTEIDCVEEINNSLVAKTSFGNAINCKKIIYATGFNWESINKENLCKRYISYTIVTNPLPQISWHKNALLQDSQDPYHYIRCLPDNRIIIGGCDTVFKGNPIDEKLAEKKYSELLKNLSELFPACMPLMKIDYSFCGCFGETDNNLGLIGKTSNENIFYCFSCGANGIINAVFGAQLIEDILTQKPNSLEGVFSPNRIK